MKKLILAALAASVVATPVLAAPYDHRPPVQKQVIVKKKVTTVKYRSWHKGDRFNHRYARNYRVISTPNRYHLRPAPKGYRWVQSGNDAVLVGIASGIISSVIVNGIR
ncbi:RcnB family protein [Flavisphingomonas formosensis]|uniref:RcnB family protein n=1 Tax=Flavisphingomonas formosensis TaxID=861534 RepID=UPI0012FA91E9|nr:RcnB family protein [Sphingomonas formosensis]